jgi:predicted  nucleic acid-binding Zn-ribbon protein
MACMEHKCTRHGCTYHDFNNETVKVCPLCGSKVISYFDEYPDDSLDYKGDVTWAE